MQDQAVTGLPAEGKMRISYEEEVVELEGGESVSLRRPSYSVAELAYGDMDPEVMLSPRVAPPMIGLGLLEEIHEQDLLNLADPEDKDGDGISGKASLVLNPETGQKGNRSLWAGKHRTETFTPNRSMLLPGISVYLPRI